MTNTHALIIEDDINSAKVLAHLLARQGIESIIVTDTAQLEGQVNETPDLVFIDLEMPRMDGYEVLTELRGIQHYNEIPIVASSVHTGEIHRVRDAGFTSFIGKPLAKDIFPGQLARILSGENVWEI